MKSLCQFFLILLSLAFLIPDLAAQNVGINNDGSTHDASSMLDVNSTSKGILIQSIPALERDAKLSSGSENLNCNNDNYKTHCYKKNIFHIMTIGSSTWRYYIGSLINNMLCLTVFEPKSEYSNLVLFYIRHKFLEILTSYKTTIFENEIQTISLFDLTGFWEDDAGGKYQIRQVGNSVAWYYDRKPVVLNVFVGLIGDNNVLSGNWYDLPGGQAMNSGSISFRVESNDKLVKINSSVFYLGSVIIRKGTSLSSNCDMNGTWRHYIQGIGESTLTFSSLGNGRYSVRESGLGNASGTANVNGTRVRLDWTSSQSGDGGYTEWDMSNMCNLGTGNLIYTYGKSGTFTNRIERIGNSNEVGGGICSNPKTLQIMDDWLLRAVPPQGPKDRLKYEEWGRLVGETQTNTLGVSGPPDTRLTRCEYLWEQSNKLESTNGMGSLKEYVLKRIQ